MKFVFAGLALLGLVILFSSLQRPTPQPPLQTAAPGSAAQKVITEVPQAPLPAKPLAAANPAPAAKPIKAAPLPQTLALFTDPVTPTVFELAPGALTVWRGFAPHKPALVLFSTHPLLMPLPAEERRAIRTFVRTASPTELVRRGRFNVADPLILAPQSVSAAIEAGLFSELVFVQPTTRSKDKISLPEFQQKVFNAGFLTEAEALALQLKDGVISGSVRGLPFRCVHPETLPRLDRPVVVHIDLGYFKDLYVNDIKTPPYNLLHQTARSIREVGWRTLAATLSYSNQEAEFALETRFLISNLATILLNPALLDGGTPPAWKLLADARFARAMFAETTADELTAQAVAVAPDDPDALYALAMQKFVQTQPDEAFSLLDRAVAHDPGYALAYVQLAESGAEKAQFEKVEELLRKAMEFLRFDPFIRIKLADLLIQRGRGSEALPLLQELQQRPWSPRYHPDIPKLLKEMRQVAEETDFSAQR